MKKILALGLTSAMILAAAACSPASPQNTGNFTGTPTEASQVRRITDDELVQKMDSGKNLLVVDTRETFDYVNGHIKGAISVPLQTILDKAWTPPSDVAEIVFYCA